LEVQTVPESTLSQTQNPETKYGRSVSLMQAAALLQVSRRTIYNRIRDGQLTTIRIHGSQRVLTSSLFGSKDSAPIAVNTAEAVHTAQL
jgi:excisionase family DNA binding protein